MIKRVLCFGDSNTWGYIPGSGERFEYNKRWTGILANFLAENYSIIEEGLNGRTINNEDPLNPGRNGLKYLLPCLESHKPLDIIILYLGTNDLKYYFSNSIQNISINIQKMIQIIREGQYGYKNKIPDIILLPIPHTFDNVMPNSSFRDSREKSISLTLEYQNISRIMHCHFLDITTKIKVSKIDGIHLDEENHFKLASLLFEKINKVEINYNN